MCCSWLGRGGGQVLLLLSRKDGNKTGHLSLRKDKEEFQGELWALSDIRNLWEFIWGESLPLRTSTWLCVCLWIERCMIMWMSSGGRYLYQWAADYVLRVWIEGVWYHKVREKKKHTAQTAVATKSGMPSVPGGRQLQSSSSFWSLPLLSVILLSHFPLFLISISLLFLFPILQNWHTESILLENITLFCPWQPKHTEANSKSSMLSKPASELPSRCRKTWMKATLYLRHLFWEWIHRCFSSRMSFLLSFLVTHRCCEMLWWLAVGYQRCDAILNWVHRTS